jgi:hypothetical protein
MPSKSKKQRDYIFYLRSQDDDKSKWFWDKDWEQIEEHKVIERYKPFFKETKIPQNIKFNLKKTGRNDYDNLFKNKDFSNRIEYMTPEFFLIKTDSHRYKLDKNKVEDFKNTFKTKKVILPTPVMIFDFNKKFINKNDLSD